MPDFPSTAKSLAVAYRAVASIKNSKIDPKAVKKAGSLMNIVAMMAGNLADEAAARAFAKLSALTLQGADGTDLDAVAAERTFREITRIGATPSRAVISVQRPAGGPGLAQTIAAGEVIGDVVGGSAVTFRLDYDVPFAAGQLGPIYTTATATAAGSATNVPQSAIARFVSPSSFTDTTFTATAVEPIAGGGDVESKGDFLARVQIFPASVQKGTLAAIQFGALTVSGIRACFVEEPVDMWGQAVGSVSVYLADLNGQCNSALVAAVRATLRDFRCCGIVPDFFPSTPSYQAISLSLGVLDGYSTLAVQALARAAVVASVARLGPKATLQRSALFAALRSVPGAVVGGGAVVVPALDVVPTLGETLRTRPDLVSFV